MTISTVQIATAEGREPALLIRRFDDKSDAMHYYEITQKNTPVFAGEINVRVLPLAISNYRFLITENKMEGYQNFLQKVYGISF